MSSEKYNIKCQECHYLWIGNPYSTEECPKCGGRIIVLNEAK